MRNNLLRGQLLRFLYDIRPEKVDKVGLYQVFYEYHKTKAIDKEIEYLVGKNYVEKTNKPHPYRTNQVISIYTITSRGVDLIEGVGTDDGVAVVVEEE